MINSMPDEPDFSSTPRAPAAQTSASTRSARSWEATRATRLRSVFFIAFLAALQPSVGCYYAHLAQGQSRVLWGRLEIEDVLADPETPIPLAERLRLVLEVRDFAQAIGLDVDQQYTSYLPWPDDRIITNLVVTEPGSVEARPFEFPLIGAMPYKGFFDESMAEAEAAKLRAEGMDTCLVPVGAYSTLGFFEDPVSDPMLMSGEGRLTETILHELVHSTFFLESRPDFNEGAANFVGQEASVLFFGSTPEKAAQRRQEVEDARSLAFFLLEFRAAVRRIYATSESLDAAASARSAAESEARERLKSLSLASYDGERLADNISLNDACLALRSTYSGDLPQFEGALARFDANLPALIAALKSASVADDPEAEFFRPPPGHPPAQSP